MDASPFARLSGELRNRIYFLAFTEPHILQDGKPYEGALTRVCRQMRSECILMFYAERKFESTIVNRQTGTILRWLKTIDKQKLSKIQRLIITCRGDSDDLELGYGEQEKCPWRLLISRLKQISLNAPTVEWAADFVPDSEIFAEIHYGFWLYALYLYGLWLLW